MKILADFYKSAKTSGMRKEWTRSLGNVTDGTYELTLEAFDSWDAAAKPLKKTFQVGSTSNSLWTMMRLEASLSPEAAATLRKIG